MSAVTGGRRQLWRLLAFGAVCVVCLGAAAVLVWRDDGPDTGGEVVTGTETVAEIQQRPHGIAVDTRLGPGYGKASVAPLDTPDELVDTDMSCDRVDMAADRGVCLRANRGVITTYQAVVFDDQFQQVAVYDLPGTPSRTRVSPGGDLGAWTTFVAGDSYLSSGLSTRTHIADLRTGEHYGDLEQFSVVKDGKPFSEVDFNFWGVSFADDENTFYVTLQSGGHQYLARGDLAAREITVLRDGVECPSISPDGTRVVFKKRVQGDMGRVEWRLSVLDLETMEEHELAETRNVDDQAQWLDDDTITYGVPVSEVGTPTRDTYAVPADGSGSPVLLVPGAWSFNPTER